jgi:hypothetical protein
LITFAGSVRAIKTCYMRFLNLAHHFRMINQNHVLKLVTKYQLVDLCILRVLIRTWQGRFSVSAFCGSICKVTGHSVRNCAI